MSLNVILLGASGRMGTAIWSEVNNQRKIKLVVPNDSNPDKMDHLLKYKPKALIDFSAPEATVEWAKWCVKNKIRMVTGVTGLSAPQQKQVLACSKKTAIVQSANMSAGVTVLTKIFEEYADRFPDFSWAIEETHHTQKKDKPSGTALLLKASLEKTKKIKVPEPASLRIGDVFGIHKITATGNGETITFEHDAKSRAIFAQGALRAVQWIVGKRPGLYTMWDVLK